MTHKNKNELIDPKYPKYSLCFPSDYNNYDTDRLKEIEKLMLLVGYDYDNKSRNAYKGKVQLIDDDNKKLSGIIPTIILPNNVKKAIELQLTERTKVTISERIESVDCLTIDLIHHLKRHHDDIHKLQWDVFEHLVAEYLASKGFQDVAIVGRNKITSADIYAVHVVDATGDRLKFYVEVKRTREKIGIDIINNVIGAVALERPDIGWDVAIIVSLAGFRKFHKTSQKKVSYLGVKLKDKDDVVSWLEGYAPGPNGLWLPKPDTSLPEPPIITQR